MPTLNEVSTFVCAFPNQPSHSGSSNSTGRKRKRRRQERPDQPPAKAPRDLMEVAGRDGKSCLVRVVQPDENVDNESHHHSVDLDLESDKGKGSAKESIAHMQTGDAKQGPADSDSGANMPQVNIGAPDSTWDPDEIVFTMPFKTYDGRMPTAASGLNELNCQMFDATGSTKEEALLSSIGCVTVCERDLKSTEQGNAPTENVCNLWLKW